MTLLGTPWSGKLDISDPASGPLIQSWFELIGALLDGGLGVDNLLSSGGNAPLAWLAEGVWKHNAGSTNGRKIMRGQKTVTTGGAASATATITYATDTIDPTGATAFASGVPVVVLTPVRGAGLPIIASLDAAPGTATSVIRVTSADNATALPASVVVHWWAAGVA